MPAQVLGRPRRIAWPPTAHAAPVSGRAPGRPTSRLVSPWHIACAAAARVEPATASCPATARQRARLRGPARNGLPAPPASRFVGPRRAGVAFPAPRGCPRRTWGGCAWPPPSRLVRPCYPSDRLRRPAASVVSATASGPAVPEPTLLGPRPDPRRLGARPRRVGVARAASGRRRLRAGAAPRRRFRTAPGPWRGQAHGGLSGRGLFATASVRAARGPPGLDGRGAWTAARGWSRGRAARDARRAWTAAAAVDGRGALPAGWTAAGRGRPLWCWPAGAGRPRPGLLDGRGR